jgi:hypothetical protein
MLDYMKNKIFALTIVTLLFTTCFISASAFKVNNNFYKQEIQTLNSGLDPLKNIELSETEMNKILDSIEIGLMIDKIRDYIQENYRQSPFKTSMLESVEKGIQSLDQIGITSTNTLSEAENTLSNIMRSNIQISTYSRVLINVIPTRATVSTIIPPVVVNITESSQSEFFNLKYEIFVKAIPFIDRIVTKQFGILRPQLTQSAIIWPTIGGRITIAGITLFIIAFGPRIRWAEAVVI